MVAQKRLTCGAKMRPWIAHPRGNHTQERLVYSGFSRSLSVHAECIGACTGLRVSIMRLRRNVLQAQLKIRLPVHKVGRFDPQLIGNLLDCREMRLTLLSLYAADATLAERADEELAGLRWAAMVSP
jgi:hypothetical protein